MSHDIQQIVVKSCYCAPTIDLPSIVLFITIGFLMGVLVGWELNRRDKE